MAASPHARHFGLSREAFALSPDPHFLWSSPEHAEALAALEVGLRTRRGLMVLVAEVGMGKTTILHALLSRLGEGFHTAYLTNTRLPFEDLLRQALDDFGVERRGEDRYSLVGALNGFLARCADDGTIPALVVDEAHDLDDETFENLRLLSNFDTFDTKLLQIVLVGQPELDDKLRQPHLRQVAERVATRVNVNPFDRRRSIAYVKHRLARAGGTLDVFTAPALEYLVHRARGVPRRLNILCHNALLSAWAEGDSRVGLRSAVAAERERTGATLVRLSAPRARRARAARLAAAGAAALGALAVVAPAGRPPVVVPAGDLVAGLADRAVPASAIAGETAVPAPLAAALPAHGPESLAPEVSPAAASGPAERGSGVRPRRATASATPREVVVGPPAPRRGVSGARAAESRDGRSAAKPATGAGRERPSVAPESGRRGRGADGRRAGMPPVDPATTVCLGRNGTASGSRA